MAFKWGECNQKLEKLEVFELICSREYPCNCFVKFGSSIKYITVQYIIIGIPFDFITFSPADVHDKQEKSTYANDVLTKRHKLQSINRSNW